MTLRPFFCLLILVPSAIFLSHSENPSAAVSGQGASACASPSALASSISVEPGTDSCTECPQMVFVAGGTFQMGCDDHTGYDSTLERPAHRVAVPDFWLGKYEVTNREFVQFLNANTTKLSFDRSGNVVFFNNRVIYQLFYGMSKGSDPNFKEMVDYDNGAFPGGKFTVRFNQDFYPAVLVTWDGARAYADWLSERTGQHYRLPSESEWEYAARGGARSQGFKYAGSNRAEDVAWFDRTAYSFYHAVGERTPNELGLYDLSGNVWEWCEDRWHNNYAVASPQQHEPEMLTTNKWQDDTNVPVDGSAWTKGIYAGRVLRGGAFDSNEPAMRVSKRYSGVPDNRHLNWGFRIARTP